MKKACAGGVVLLLVVCSYLVSPAADKYMDIQTGDEIYACNCGKDCSCQSMAKTPGDCTCGKEMAKTRVVKSGGDTAILISDAWGGMRIFQIIGKYSCGSPDDNCGMVSQNPGKCRCGEEMK